MKHLCQFTLKVCDACSNFVIRMFGLSAPNLLQSNFCSITGFIICCRSQVNAMLSKLCLSIGLSAAILFSILACCNTKEGGKGLRTTQHRKLKWYEITEIWMGFFCQYQPANSKQMIWKPIADATIWDKWVIEKHRYTFETSWCT